MAVTDKTVLTVNTGEISDSVSQYVGITRGINHFCGHYKFSLASTSAIPPAVVPEMVSLCTSNCGDYDNYILATLQPVNNDLLGLVPFTLDVYLSSYSISALAP